MQVYHRVIDTRQILDNMMAGCDDRLLVVIGPSAVAGGAEKLRAIGETMAKLSSKMSRDLVLVLQADAAMGHAPNPDGTYQINRGIRQSRELLLQINKLGLPTAVEFRDTITPQFFADLLSWASVSAQSETLQELVSGLSMPVGLRAPAEDVGSLLRALETSKGHHHFLGVSSEGIVGIVESTGNPDVLAVLSPPTAAAAAAAAASLSHGLQQLHKRRPSASLMVELGEADLGATLDAVLEAEVAAGGYQASRLVGVRLHVPAELCADAGALDSLMSRLAAAVRKRRASASPRPAGATADGTETDNLRIRDVRPLLPPACLLEELPRLPEQAELIRRGRVGAQRILSGTSDRVLALIGPASVDDPAAALEYAARLAALSRDVASELLLVMSVRLSTPVTPSDGPWPGMLFDPERDGTYQINRGIRQSRELLLQINKLGLPTAVEFRDTITPQFFADLLSWASVSAQSETLQELVSGLSMPVGLRAFTAAEGSADDLVAASAAVGVAAHARHFLGVTSHGLAGIVQSTGNTDCAILLGGGAGSEPAVRARRILDGCAGFGAVVAECGTARSTPSDQEAVASALIEAIGGSADGAPRGLSLNSYLLAGAQPQPAWGGAQGGEARAKERRIHGLSSTEPCIDWLTTEDLVRRLAGAVRKRREVTAAKKRPRDG